MNLRETTAAYVLGIVPPERLPTVALTALESGMDSTSLAVLAGESVRADPRELRSLFEEALRELSMATPSLLEARAIGIVLFVQTKHRR